MFSYVVKYTKIFMDTDSTEDKIMDTETMNILFAFIGGLGMFLYGMHIMAAGLQKAAGKKMRKILEVLTKNKFTGVLVGALVTAIIQSSSATTVMVVGFVNAGLMSLGQTIGIIMGANIGTTITSWLVASIEWATLFKPSTIAPIALGIGVVLILFSNKNSRKNIGEILVGFGILFIGIDTMTNGLDPISDSPVLADIFTGLGSNPFLGVLAGAVVTAIIQSSSASVGILQSLALGGAIPWNSAVYIIMGQNIGTCVTALLSSAGANRNAKGAAYVHLLFNIIGSILFSILAVIFFKYINVQLGESPITLTEISIVHTAFNIANTVLLYPFSNKIVSLAERICSIRHNEVDESQPVHLDDRILETPSFAILNCAKEITRLGNMAKDNLNLAMDALMTKDENKIEKVFAREKSIDKLDNAITQYMVKLCNTNITEYENNMVTALFHTVNDMERIGDHSENLAELAQFMINEEIEFSGKAKEEIKFISDKTISSVNTALKSFEENDLEIAKEVYAQEKEIDGIEQNLRAKHIDRLAKNSCNPVSGVAYLDTITNLERISDYALNVAQAVVKIKLSKSEKPKTIE